ncbi:uncharacterized protein LOC143247796 isoform X2 [Tachypleus tridentatus]
MMDSLFNTTFDSQQSSTHTFPNVQLKPKTCVENENHCDFVKLWEMLIRVSMQDMIEQTHTHYYELYHKMRLEQMGFSDVGADNKPVSFQETCEQKRQEQEHLQANLMQNSDMGLASVHKISYSCSLLLLICKLSCYICHDPSVHNAIGIK